MEGTFEEVPSKPPSKLSTQLWGGCEHRATVIWFENDTEHILFCGIESVRGNVTGKRSGTTHGPFLQVSS